MVGDLIADTPVTVGEMVMLGATTMVFGMATIGGVPIVITTHIVVIIIVSNKMCIRMADEQAKFMGRATTLRVIAIVTTLLTRQITLSIMLIKLFHLAIRMLGEHIGTTTLAE